MYTIENHAMDFHSTISSNNCIGNNNLETVKTRGLLDDHSIESEDFLLITVETKMNCYSWLLVSS